MSNEIIFICTVFSVQHNGIDIKPLCKLMFESYYTWS